MGGVNSDAERNMLLFGTTDGPGGMEDEEMDQDGWEDGEKATTVDDENEGDGKGGPGQTALTVIVRVHIYIYILIYMYCSWRLQK